MHQEEHWIDTLVYNATRIAIIIPMIMIISGISLNFMGYGSISNTTTTVAKNTVTPTVVHPNQDLFSGIVSNASEQKLDLTGPWACKQTNTQGEIQAFIKNNNISVSITRNNEKTSLLVNNGCLYRWSEKSSTGSKNCKIASLLSVAPILIQFSNLDQLLTLINNSNLIPALIPTTEVQSLAEISKSCKKESIEDTVFAVPTTITFTEVIPSPTRDISP